MKIPGPKVGICQALDEKTVEKASKPENQFNGFPLRPSSAGKCARQLSYSLMKFKGYAEYPIESREANVDRLLKLGHSIEYSAFRNFDVIEDREFVYKQQVVGLFYLKHSKKLIEGSMDAFVRSEEGNGVIDIKSVKDKFSAFFKTKYDETLEKFKEMKSLKPIGDSGMDFYAPCLKKFLEEVNDPFLEDNFLQLNLYCLSPFSKARNCKFGEIYKYNKNDSRHYSIRFKPSKDLFNYVKDKYNAVDEIIETTKDPSQVRREYTYGSMKCAFCEFNKECWGQDHEALKEWFKTFPKKKWPVDVGELENPKHLRDLFEKFKVAQKYSEQQKVLEEEILNLLIEQKVDKIKLDQKDIWVIKPLKAGPALRRSKL